MENAGQDITKEQLIAVATPNYSTGQEVSPSRFIQQLSAITCSICKHIINKAVEAKCCQHSFCTDCIWHWLGIKASCPVCRFAMSASQLVLPSVCCQSVLAEICIHCDNYADAFNGCSEVMPLSQLRPHVQTCNNTQKHTVTKATQVGDILNASPTKLRGSMSDVLTGHLVKTKADNGMLELRGRGPSQTWKRTTVATVPSQDASARTVRRRRRSQAELKHTRTLMCGSSEGFVIAQQAASISHMEKEERDAPLNAAGIIAKTPGTGSTLALKADLHMPWNQLRKLRVWMKDYGVRLEVRVGACNASAAT
eukprot:scpid42676/ scgid16057/ E3 ubiquitin-protein ligase NRDP1; RING finger protein 41 &gt; E3 ubiquitin-protein ligase NRDP1; RING finger protein 41